MDKNEEIKNKNDNIPEDLTREINLDDLYDGAVNNTVVIDPVTNNELLLTEKKPNFALIGLLLAVLVLLGLYYINNKTNLGGSVKNIVPKTTVTTTTAYVNKAEPIKKKNGRLLCKYSSHSDSDAQDATYTLNVIDDVISDSNFNYIVTSKSETTTAVVDDLTKQYENFYINNASLSGNSVMFEKTEKSFTFNVDTKYETAEFDKIILTEGQAILYVKPTKDDTYEGLLNSYTSKGFTCNFVDNEV